MEKSCLLEIFLSSYLVNQQMLPVRDMDCVEKVSTATSENQRSNSWDLWGRRREAAPAGCPLSTYQRWHKHTHRDTHAHKANRGSNKNTLLYVVWVKLVGTATMATCTAELQRAENISCCVEQRTEISLAKEAKCGEQVRA